MRQTKVTMVNPAVNRAYAHLRDEGGRLLSAGERAALAFAGKTEILMACERYNGAPSRDAIGRCRRWQSSNENYGGRRRSNLSDLLVRSCRVPSHSVRRTYCGWKSSK